MARHHLIDGVKVPFTAEEEAAYDKIKKEWEDGALDRALQNLRDKRNNLLAETDYLALSDNTLSDDMKTYRQNLRDLPAGKDTVEKCENAVFPTKP